MFDVKRLKYWIYLTIVVFLAGFIYVAFFCPGKICAPTSGLATTAALARPNQTRPDSYADVDVGCNSSRSSSVDDDDLRPYTRGTILHPNLTTEALDGRYAFDVDGDVDVLVFLHIQKTGGTTFGKHLVRDMKIERPCLCYKGRKRCDCLNGSSHLWLFSRYSTGWRCGLHADWTELTSCVDDVLNDMEHTRRPRRFLYMTILREPYNRYVSEYKHVKRGATWMSARLQCNGRQATLKEVPFCFEDEDWSGVSLDEFMSCPHNLANNRQTRMLANLSLSDCYGSSPLSRAERDCIMLNSAKENLNKMAFFGLTEYQVETQYLFERTFGLEFNEDFFQYNRTHASDVVVSEAQKRRILELNKLDLALYAYAKKLFFLRLNAARQEEARQDDVRQRGGRRRSRVSNRDDYEEGDENYTDDDSQVNHRLLKKLGLMASRDGKNVRHNKRTVSMS